MNILVKSIQDVMFLIPEEVLRLAFLPKYNGWNAPAQSLEDQILSLVVKARVIPDASIAKGEHMTIRLGDITPKFIDDWRCIYEIPERKLLGKTILSVIDISYSPYSGGVGSFGYAYGGVGPMFSQDFMTAATQMVEANAAVPNVSTARVELAGENTILIEDSQRYNTAYYLNCYVTDNNYLNKIDPRSFEYFSTLVEHAVKAYIYRKLRVALDKGYIEGGAELGVIKDIVMEFADSETNYRTFLKETWAAVAFMDNRPRYMRFIKSQIPIGL